MTQDAGSRVHFELDGRAEQPVVGHGPCNHVLQVLQVGQGILGNPPSL